MKPPRVVGCVLLGLLGLGSPAPGQDLRRTAFEWVNPDPPDTLPVFKYLDDPKMPDGLEKSTNYDYAELYLLTLASGEIGSLWLAGTHPMMTNPRGVLTGPIGKAAPAKREGQAVNSLVRAAIIYNPKAAAGKGADVVPRLLRVASVQWPHKKRDRLPDVVRLNVTVTDSGRVTAPQYSEGLPAAVRAACNRALARWVFAPARRDGQVVEAQIEVPLLIQSGELVESVGQGEQPPEVIKRANPAYPHSQTMTRFKGEVAVRFTVDIEGRPRDIYIQQSSNPAFDESAVEAIEQWRFKPGLKNGKPAPMQMQITIVFSLHGEAGRDAFVVQTSKKKLAQLPAALQFDTPPKPAHVPAAVYPFDALLTKKKGEVDFSFIVDQDGYVSEMKVLASPGPEFDGAARAMTEEMRFEPALKAGQPCLALLRMKLKFDESFGEVSLSTSARRLMNKLRTSEAAHAVAAANELDGPLEPISRKPPLFPRQLQATEKSQGEALVEFFVDRTGVVLLPRTISATDPAFGYAACQAVAGWRFKPPLQDGKPVAARVQVPVKFTLK